MKKIRVKKIKLIFVIALLVSVVGIYSLIKPKTTDVDFLFQNPTTTATVILVGDIMLDRGVEAEMENNGDWKWPFLEITDELKKADIVFGNLEGPISDMGTKVGSIYSFRADPKTIEGLTFAGFDILSVANNHALDYGRDALEDTFLRLRQANIDYVGGGNTLAEADSPISKEVDGTKIAFLAYTNLCSESWNATEKNSGINCIAEDDLETVKQKIRDTKNNADVLIVSLHSGGEYTQTLTALQTDFARSAIDAGADMVVEGHSHVVQKNEAYKDKYIFYSLGNFVFDQNFSEETMQGQMLKILIENKKIKEIIPIKIDINTDFQPEIAPAKKPFKLTQPSLPQIYLSASKLAQGDTLVIRVDNGTNTGKISATFGTTKIDFFKSGTWFGILGIDAKKAPGKYALDINFPDGEKITKTIEVVKRNFPVTELTFTPELEEQGYNATSVAEDNISDSSKLYEAMAVSSPTAYFTEAFTYPLEKIEDVGAFGNIRQSGDLSLQHLGTDLQADMDSKVYAANDGVVTGVLNLTDYGKTIVIDHGLGIFSLYLHLNKFNVTEGQMVKKDDIVGYSGNTGYSIAPHLHFSIKAGNASVDPIEFVKTTIEGIK